MFIFMPCEDPLVRYDLVTSCFEYAGNRDPHFFLPDVPRTGEKLSNSFLKRQLLSRGVPQDNITTHDFGKLPDCIAESLIMINLLPGKVTCIATARKDMSSLEALEGCEKYGPYPKIRCHLYASGNDLLLLVTCRNHTDASTIMLVDKTFLYCLSLDRGTHTSFLMDASPEIVHPELKELSVRFTVTLLPYF